MSNSLPAGLNPLYWSTWQLSRAGISVAESLEEGEAWIGGWDGVGLYEGNNKVPEYQSLTVHITTHRLLLVLENTSNETSNSSRTIPRSLQAPMSAVRQTEFYTGFMRSSAKITLFLSNNPSVSSLEEPITSEVESREATPSVSEEVPTSNGWTCGVCGFVNVLMPGTAVMPTSKCQLCGVGYATSCTISLPPSRSATPRLPQSPPRADSPPQIPIPPTESASVSDKPDVDGQIACPACTFLNHKSMTQCEICSTPLPRARPVSVRTTGTPTPRPPDNTRSDIVRLSFRKGGEREAYRRLKNVLSDKAWDRSSGRRQASSSSNANGTSETSEATPSGVGIDAILRSINLDARAQDDNMQDAFRDLEVLMIRAGEMVRLAQSLNAKLTAQQAASGVPAASDEDATLVRSSLVQLGLPAPALTMDMVRDQRKYLDGLAQELGSLLTGRPGRTAGALMLDAGRGVIGLDEVWGLWMRARGVALLPPSTLVSLLPLLPLHTSPPIRSLTLPSSLTVLHSPLYAPAVLKNRLVERMRPSSDTGELGLNIIDIAAGEGLPIGLAKELVELIEISPSNGTTSIVRDDQAGPGEGGTKWYRDIIASWPLGQMGQ